MPKRKGTKKHVDLPKSDLKKAESSKKITSK